MRSHRLVFIALIAMLPLQTFAATPVAGCGDQGKVAAAQRLKNTARWSTASEVDSFGYDVYRGDAEKGPFAKVTKSPVLGSGTTDETHNYQYADDSIDPCREYWYYVESISTKGVREKFTPVFRAAAKLGADGKPVAKPADAATKPAPSEKH